MWDQSRLFRPELSAQYPTPVHPNLVARRPAGSSDFAVAVAVALRPCRSSLPFVVALRRRRWSLLLRVGLDVPFAYTSAGLND